ncbi:MAG: termination factor Rho [Pseudomonadota bacterium]
MPRGDKRLYSDKQKRKAEHIEQSYEQRGVPEEEAEARAWATVNKQSGGGERGGSGEDKSPQAKKAARKDSARRAAATKAGHSPHTTPAASRGRDDLDDMSKAELLERARERQIVGRSRMDKAQLLRALRNQTDR